MPLGTLSAPPRRGASIPADVLDADRNAVRSHQEPAPIAPRPVIWADDELARRTALPRVKAAAGAARNFLTAVAADWRLPQEVAETLRLLVSELVTNAVLHAAAPAGAADAVRVEVNLVAGSVVVLAVSDEDPTAPTERALPTARQVKSAKGTAGIGGAGLAVVKALSAGFGTVSRDSGKTVWCVVPVAPGAKAAAR